MASSFRIASLISSGTEILFALGLGDRVVAVSHECDYPAEAARRPHATRSRIDSSRSSGSIDNQVRALLQAGLPLYEVDAWLLRQLRPELIVTQAQCDVCAVRYEDVRQLVATDPAFSSTRLLTLQPTSLDDVLNDIRRVGEAADAVAAAERLTAELRQRIAAVKSAWAGPGSQSAPTREGSAPTGHVPAPTGYGASLPRVICLEWLDPLMTAGNWTPQLIHEAGGQSGLAEPGEHSRYVSWEAIRRYDPEILVVAPCGFDLRRSVREAESLVRREGWRELRAVRNGRVFALDGNAYLNRSGPRLVTTLEILAHLLHPEKSLPHTLGAEARRAFCRLETGGDISRDETSSGSSRQT